MLDNTTQFFKDKAPACEYHGKAIGLRGFAAAAALLLLALAAKGALLLLR